MADPDGTLDGVASDLGEAIRREVGGTLDKVGERLDNGDYFGAARTLGKPVGQAAALATPAARARAAKPIAATPNVPKTRVKNEPQSRSNPESSVQPPTQAPKPQDTVDPDELFKKTLEQQQRSLDWEEYMRRARIYEQSQEAFEKAQQLEKAGDLEGAVEQAARAQELLELYIDLNK